LKYFSVTLIIYKVLHKQENILAMYRLRISRI